MIYSIHKRQSSLFRKVLHGFIALTFLSSVILPPTPVFAQTVLNLPVPGAMVPPSAGFMPALMTGVTIHPDNPLRFDFIMDRGQSDLSGEPLKEEYRKMIKYFMASLTVPEDELWVNLSPYEKDRMITDGLGKTEMGRDMLAQDYLLKQLTASLMYPEKELGKEFWDKVYKQAKEKFGTTEIPVNTFNKVWIVPDEALVYEQGSSAFVIKSRLAVMLEQDYEAMSHQDTKSPGHQDSTGDVVTATEGNPQQGSDVVTTGIIREVIIPAIEQEVNEGKNFANLRQMYNALILATWYKQRLKDSLLGKVYVDQNKTKGIDTQDKEINQKIYDQYIESFKKGVYNFIKEDVDPATQEIIPRKYFSGGMAWKLGGFKTLGVFALGTLLSFGSPDVGNASSLAAAAMGGNKDGVVIELAELGPGAASNAEEGVKVTSGNVQPFLAQAALASDEIRATSNENASSPISLGKSPMTGREREQVRELVSKLRVWNPSLKIDSTKVYEYLAASLDSDRLYVRGYYSSFSIERLRERIRSGDIDAMLASLISGNLFLNVLAKNSGLERTRLASIFAEIGFLGFDNFGLKTEMSQENREKEIDRQIAHWEGVLKRPTRLQDNEEGAVSLKWKKWAVLELGAMGQRGDFNAGQREGVKALLEEALADQDLKKVAGTALRNIQAASSPVAAGPAEQLLNAIDQLVGLEAYRGKVASADEKFRNAFLGFLDKVNSFSGGLSGMMRKWDLYLERSAGSLLDSVGDLWPLLEQNRLNFGGLTPEDKKDIQQRLQAFISAHGAFQDAQREQAVVSSPLEGMAFTFSTRRHSKAGIIRSLYIVPLNKTIHLYFKNGEMQHNTISVIVDAYNQTFTHVSIDETRFDKEYQPTLIRPLTKIASGGEFRSMYLGKLGYTIHEYFEAYTNQETRPTWVFAEAGDKLSDSFSAIQKRMPASSPVEEGQEKPVVLLVEDHAGLRKAYSLGLSGQYEVIEASDGQEALELIRREPGKFKLVISDQNMPIMQGNELALHLKEEFPRLPVVLMTAQSVRDFAVFARELKEQSPNVVDVLDKAALTPDAFLGIIREVLAKAQGGEPPASSPVTEQQGQGARVPSTALGTSFGRKEQGVASDEQRATNDKGPATKGGIDLNPALLDLQIRRDGNGVPLPLPMQPIENMHIDGFLPVIINIVPITNLPQLLGLDLPAQEEKPVQLTYQELSLVVTPARDRLYARDLDEVLS